MALSLTLGSFSDSKRSKMGLTALKSPIWDRIARIQNRGIVSLFEYDRAGRLTKQQHGRSGAAVYRYDEAGRIIEARNGKES